MRPKANSGMRLHILQIDVLTSNTDEVLEMRKTYIVTFTSSGSVNVSRPMLRYRSTAHRPTAATGMSSIFRCLRSSIHSQLAGMLIWQQTLGEPSGKLISFACDRLDELLST